MFVTGAPWYPLVHVFLVIAILEQLTENASAFKNSCLVTKPSPSSSSSITSTKLILVGGFKLPSFSIPGFESGLAQGSLQDEKQKLFDAVSFTSNGKNATPEKQSEVLSIVSNLERSGKPDDALLENPNLAQKLDGTWYLQWTSPSNVGDKDQFPNEWKPDFASENDTIETKSFAAKGSVVAAGVTVDTSNRVVKQIFDVPNSRVSNEIGLDFGTLTVAGPFKASENVPCRAVVTFEDLRIDLNIGIKLNLDWVFRLIRAAKGSGPGGWLETTYIDDDMRIGRGNKGTCFVLTRDLEAVKP